MDYTNSDDFEDQLVHPSKILVNGIPLDRLHDFGASRRRRYRTRNRVAHDVKRFSSEVRSVRTEDILSANTRSTSNDSPQRESHFSLNSGLLYISNINNDVKDSDLYSIFSNFGQVVRAANNYGIDGHPNGTALIVFANRDHAIEAYKALNGQLLKGQNLSIYLLPQSRPPVSQQKRHFWAERAENYDKEEVFCNPGESDSDSD